MRLKPLVPGLPDPCAAGPGIRCLGDERIGASISYEFPRLKSVRRCDANVSRIRAAYVSHRQTLLLTDNHTARVAALGSCRLVGGGPQDLEKMAGTKVKDGSDRYGAAKPPCDVQCRYDLQIGPSTLAPHERGPKQLTWDSTGCLGAGIRSDGKMLHAVLFPTLP